MQDNVLVFYMSGQVDLLCRMTYGICSSLCRDVQQFGEIEQCVFAGCRWRGWALIDQVRTPDDVIQPFEAHLRQVFPDLFGEEGEEVHQIFVTAVETFAQFLVLGGDTHRAGVHVAFAHHHAAQYDQGGGGETELFGSQQGHQDDVAPGLQLSVGLQPDLPAKVIHDQCLLRLRQSQFGRQSGVADGAHRRSTCSPFGSRYDDAVGFSFCYACCNCPDTAFRYQLHAYFGTRVDIFQVEDQLCQVFDRVNVMVGRRRDQ